MEMLISMRNPAPLERPLVWQRATRAAPSALVFSQPLVILSRAMTTTLHLSNNHKWITL